MGLPRLKESDEAWKNLLPVGESNTERCNTKHGSLQLPACSTRPMRTNIIHTTCSVHPSYFNTTTVLSYHRDTGAVWLFTTYITIESTMYVIAHKALGVNMKCLPVYPYS